MATRFDEYQKQADHCRLQAGKAKHKDEQVEWLSMAATWQRMADEASSPSKAPGPRAKKESR
jgi:hypothetical protein